MHSSLCLWTAQGIRSQEVLGRLPERGDAECYAAVAVLTQAGILTPRLLMEFGELAHRRRSTRPILAVVERELRQPCRLAGEDVGSRETLLELFGLAIEAFVRKAQELAGGKALPAD